MKSLKFTLAVLALTTGAAFAQDLDADGDGSVTYEEATALYPDMTEEDFAEADTNDDGVLDADEVAVAEESGLFTAE
jgi:opacity protein-like surface antigen